MLLRPDGRLPLRLLPPHGLQGSPPRRQPADLHRPVDGPAALRLGRRGLRPLGDADRRARVAAGAADCAGRDHGAVQRPVARCGFFLSLSFSVLGEMEKNWTKKRNKKETHALPLFRKKTLSLSSVQLNNRKTTVHGQVCGRLCGAAAGGAEDALGERRDHGELVFFLVFPAFFSIQGNALYFPIHSLDFSLSHLLDSPRE